MLENQRDGLADETAPTLEQIRARNVVIQPAGETFNKMRKQLPMERSESNQLLKFIKFKKRLDYIEKSRQNLT